jgi:hypothetical protein
VPFGSRFWEAVDSDNNFASSGNQRVFIAIEAALTASQGTRSQQTDVSFDLTLTLSDLRKRGYNDRA